MDLSYNRVRSEVVQLDRHGHILGRNYICQVADSSYTHPIHSHRIGVHIGTVLRVNLYA